MHNHKSKSAVACCTPLLGNLLSTYCKVLVRYLAVPLEPTGTKYGWRMHAEVAEVAMRRTFVLQIGRAATTNIMLHGLEAWHHDLTHLSPTSVCVLRV